MASEQAATIVEAEAVVIPTKSIPQGIAALFNFDVADTLTNNKKRMIESLEVVTSGSVTYAVRDTKVDGVEIKKDAFMGLVEDKIITSNEDQIETVKNLLAEMITDESEIITMIVGEDAHADITSSVESWIEATYPDIEIDQHQGNQPVYQYLFSVE